MMESLRANEKGIGKLVFVDFQTRCIAAVGAAISRPETFKFLNVSDKRKHFR